MPCSNVPVCENGFGCPDSTYEAYVAIPVTMTQAPVFQADVAWAHVYKAPEVTEQARSAGPSEGLPGGPEVVWRHSVSIQAQL